MYKILIIEDEEKIANEIGAHLIKYGYEYYAPRKFDDVLNVFIKFSPHIVLLELNLPQYDGFYWSRKIRQISQCPIIILSARNSEVDQVYGIENGADDFITKPFQLNVVLSKIKSQIRRCYGEYSDDNYSGVMEIKGTYLNQKTIRIYTEETEEFLTVKEIQLCSILFEEFPYVVTRQQLLSAIWDSEQFVEENTLTVNIKRLRDKLRNINSSLEIMTIRGIGYQLVEKRK